MPEAAFNAACYHTGLGDYQNALEELGRAETLCRQTYDDQEDELSSELAQVRLQDSFLKFYFQRYRLFNGRFTVVRIKFLKSDKDRLYKST